jgi:hypothetical protein
VKTSCNEHEAIKTNEQPCLVYINDSFISWLSNALPHPLPDHLFIQYVSLLSSHTNQLLPYHCCPVRLEVHPDAPTVFASGSKEPISERMVSCRQ